MARARGLAQQLMSMQNTYINQTAATRNAVDKRRRRNKVASASRRTNRVRSHR